MSQNRTRPRGGNFTPSHDLALAQSYLSTSETADDLTADRFWNRVAELFVEQPEQEEHPIDRTLNSLKNRFSHISRVAQKYLQCDKTYRQKIPSGQTEEDTLREIMILYQKTHEVKNAAGELKDAPRVRFLEAVRLLSKSPKWSQKIGGGSRTCSNYKFGGPRKRSDLEHFWCDSKRQSIFKPTLPC